ncbi:MAG: lipocalin-like domain-containing protein [Opitutales bacterium]
MTPSRPFLRRLSPVFLLPCVCLIGEPGSAPDPQAVPDRTEGGFAVPQPGHPFQFPEDHGSHPAFAIEWWYITGHLFAGEDRRFGFQATFFRNAGPPDSAAGGDPTFRADQLFLAHMALFDVQKQTFYHQERLARMGWNADAAEGRLDIFTGPWSLRAKDYQPEGDPETMELVGGTNGEMRFTLSLRPEKGRTLFGIDGWSRKGPELTASSYYITFTRLSVDGTVNLPGENLTVTGFAWMDHEISSNQLGDNQVGWDWTAIHLHDGTEIMAYRLRRKDGSTDPYSFFNWVAADGTVTTVNADAFTWQGGGDWTSPNTGGTYPIAPTLTATHPETGLTETYRLEPLGRDLELAGTLGGIAYWEGPCRVRNAEGAVIGDAFLELTGYAQDLGDRL